MAAEWELCHISRKCRAKEDLWCLLKSYASKCSFNLVQRGFDMFDLHSKICSHLTWFCRNQSLLSEEPNIKHFTVIFRFLRTISHFIYFFSIEIIDISCLLVFMISSNNFVILNNFSVQPLWFSLQHFFLLAHFYIHLISNSSTEYSHLLLLLLKWHWPGHQKDGKYLRSTFMFCRIKHEYLSFIKVEEISNCNIIELPGIWRNYLPWL